MTHVQNADGQGQLLIGDRLSPVAYHVTVDREGDRFAASVEVQAPRDWLIRQGFKRSATLVLASGDRAAIGHDGQLDVSESISVVLQTGPLHYDDRETLVQAFPEVEGGAG